MKDLISIVVPIYNVEKYLHRCINSLINQTYKNLEIILVNDGSKDNCGIICDEFARNDRRIVVIHKENGGLSDARNEGIKLANGKYITFLDSDDWIKNTYIETLYNLLIKSNSDISVCSFLKISDEHSIIESSDEKKIVEFTNIEALGQLYGSFSSQMFVAWGKLYKIELFDDISYPYGKIHEDDFTTYKLLYKANKIILTTEKLLYYWQRNDSIMGQGFNPKHIIHLLEAYEERGEFLYKHGLECIASKTYKSTFFIYLRIYLEVEKFYDVISKNEVEKKLKEFKVKLKYSNQEILFSILYKLFYICPSFYRMSYKILKKMKVDEFLKVIMDLKLKKIKL